MKQQFLALLDNLGDGQSLLGIRLVELALKKQYAFGFESDAGKLLFESHATKEIGELYRFITSQLSENGQELLAEFREFMDLLGRGPYYPASDIRAATELFESA